MHDEPLGISLGEWHHGCCRHSSGAVSATVQHAVRIHRWSLLTSKVAHKRIRVSFYCCLHLSKWCVLLFCCCFMCSSCTPALLLCSTTETPGGIGQHSNMCVFVWVCVCVVQERYQHPQNTFSLSFALSHTHTYTQPLSLSCGQCFCWAMRQNAKPSSNLGPFFFLESPKQIFTVNALAIIWAWYTALEGRIRAGLGKIKSLLSLN